MDVQCRRASLRFSRWSGPGAALTFNGAGIVINAGSATIKNQENFFNNGGTLAPAFVPLLGITGSNLASGLDQLSGLRALERDEDIPGPTVCLERGGPTLVQVWCVVAGCQRVAVQAINPLPRLAL
jgi:hypothetical protein